MTASERIRQAREVDESANRAEHRRRLALDIACEHYGDDGVEIDNDTAHVEYVEAGYWVRARVWVDAEAVEERL